MNQRVLLVDDDRWWAENYQKILEREGYECRIASTADMALQTVDDFTPAAIVLDFLMPGANAMQLLHELQSYNDTHDLPVILCTSLGGDSHLDIESLESYGVRLVLDKAIMTPRQLIKAVKAVIV